MFRAGLLGTPVPPRPNPAANVRGQFLARVRLAADQSGRGPWYTAAIESGAGTTEQERRLADIKRVRLLTDPTGGDAPTAVSVNELAADYGPVFELRTIPAGGRAAPPAAGRHRDRPRLRRPLGAACRTAGWPPRRGPGPACRSARWT